MVLILPKTDVTVVLILPKTDVTVVLILPQTDVTVVLILQKTTVTVVLILPKHRSNGDINYTTKTRSNGGINFTKTYVTVVLILPNKLAFDFRFKSRRMIMIRNNGEKNNNIIFTILRVSFTYIDISFHSARLYKL